MAVRRVWKEGKISIVRDEPPPRAPAPPPPPPMRKVVRRVWEEGKVKLEREMVPVEEAPPPAPPKPKPAPSYYVLEYKGRKYPTTAEALEAGWKPSVYKADVAKYEAQVAAAGKAEAARVAKVRVAEARRPSILLPEREVPMEEYLRKEVMKAPPTPPGPPGVTVEPVHYWEAEVYVPPEKKPVAVIAPVIKEFPRLPTGEIVTPGKMARIEKEIAVKGAGILAPEVALRLAAFELEEKARVLYPSLPQVFEVPTAAGLAAAQFGVGVAMGVTGVVLHPIETVKYTVKGIMHPFEAMESISIRIQEAPFQTIGEMYGAAKITGAITKLAMERILPRLKRLPPKPTPEYLKPVPKERIIKTPFPKEIKGFEPTTLGKARFRKLFEAREVLPPKAIITPEAVAPDIFAKMERIRVIDPFKGIERMKVVETGLRPPSAVGVGEISVGELLLKTELISPAVAVTKLVAASEMLSLFMLREEAEVIGVTEAISIPLLKEITIPKLISPTISVELLIAPTITPTIALTELISPAISAELLITPTITPTIALTELISPAITTELLASLEITPTIALLITPTLMPVPTLLPMFERRPRAKPPKRRPRALGYFEREFKIKGWEELFGKKKRRAGKKPGLKRPRRATQALGYFEREFKMKGVEDLFGKKKRKPRKKKRR